jgi:two-component system chemotaxis sensor kinase CheA
MEDLLKEFLTETGESLDVVDVELVRFEQEPNNAEVLGRIFRLVHTIKGTCGFIGLPRLEALAHAAETVMGKFRDGAPVTPDAVTLVLSVIDRLKVILSELESHQREPEGSDTDLIERLEQLAEDPHAAASPLLPQVIDAPAIADPEPEIALFENPDDRRDSDRRVGERRYAAAPRAQTLRVTVDTVERLMTMVSELVLTRNQLLEIVRKHQESEFKVPLQRLSNVTAELQEGVMKTRMQPIGNAWAKLPRIVRDLAVELGKEIDIEMHGAETELDRQVLDIIRDPLTHMIRNSADHGLEMPEQRRAAGKPAQGTIRLSAYQTSGQIVIEIADDGRGLDIERIRRRAVLAGLIGEGERLSDAQLQKLIFAPGFSTADKVTSVSGRGVGMDVVKTNIDQIGGTIDLRSVPGRGTTFSIKIPLTLAIVSALIVESRGERFAIPQVAVVELVHRNSGNGNLVERVNDALVLRLRDKLLPLVSLGTMLKLGDTPAADAEPFVVVMQVGTSTFGLMVDDVVHTEEIVVKPVASRLRHIKVLGGNTILGDGSVIMILDPNGVAEALGATREERTIDDFASGETEKEDPALRPVSMLMFRAGGASMKAVPLSLVTRLEEIDARTIEFNGGRAVVQCRGGLMPLVPMAERTLRSEGKQPLLVFTEGGRSVGLVVDEIVDIVEERLDIKVGSDVPGTLGSAILRDLATEIVDIAHYLPKGHADWFEAEPSRAGGGRRRLLFVDGSEFFRSLLGPVLQAAGFDVVTMANAEDALAYAERMPAIDVAVCATELAGIDGFAFAERLHARRETARVPVIALASAFSPQGIVRAEGAGMHRYIAKFDRRGLLQTLHGLAMQWREAA